MPNPVSASLLRRIAEAADGHRTGDPVWVAARTEVPYDIEVFSKEEDAQQATRSDAREVFGPYVTPEDPQDELVEAVSITIRRANGQEETVDLEPTVDAIFLSQAAVDKFARPYYARFPEFDVQLESVGPLPVGHDRNTRWLPQ